ncbi:hypothetical protein [uncultured Chloroflexus sp.]|uniref:hypothetical protein n=1 Tax=uncultured Chloroflexus sp. TaxID=214040 RepID=UPI002631BC2D|nr:hypothetical protein [uncultured Chloroflexus sp.]
MIQPAIVSYNRAQVIEIIRTQSPEAIRARLRAGDFDQVLDPDGHALLDELLTAWIQRAVGPLTLRDAMLIDPYRGRQVYGILCAMTVRQRVEVPADMAIYLPAAPTDLAQLPPPLAGLPELAALAAQAAQTGLTLAWQAQRYDFAPPSNLLELTPPPPAPYRNDLVFEQPTGLRRWIAIVLAVSGVIVLIVPLLFGHIPEHPASWPLALLTLALMIGIKAGPLGYLGAFCIWLVANLPSLRQGTPPISLWPDIPLVALGLLLLWRDRRVRAMWQFIRRQFKRRHDVSDAD